MRSTVKDRAELVAVPNSAAEDVEETRDRRGIQSIEVGGQLLLALGRTGKPMVLKELAREAGMPAAKAHPYLVSFARLGLIEQDPLTGRYELGPQLLQLGLVSLQRLNPVARQSKQVIQRQSAIHPMVEQCLAGKLMSSPKPPAAGARRARLYSSLPARHHNCRMQLPMDEALQRQ